MLTCSLTQDIFTSQTLGLLLLNHKPLLSFHPIVQNIVITTCTPKQPLNQCIIYGIRRSLSVIGSITEVKQRRARFTIGWVTAWWLPGAVYTRGAQRTM